MPDRKSTEAEGGVAKPAEVELVLQSEDGRCPVCGVVEPHRHCNNCGDTLDVADERGHMMQSGVFSCSPMGEGDKGVHVAI